MAGGNGKSDDQIPDSEGDQHMQLLRGEISRQIEALMGEFMPGGVNGLMDQIVAQVVNALPQIDYDVAAKKALDLARVEMAQEAEKIGSQISAQASSGNGPVAPTANGDGHHEGDGHDHGQPATPEPQGYTFASVPGATSLKDGIRSQIVTNPMGMLNFFLNTFFDKGFTMMERWHQLHKPDDLAVLRNLHQTKPELFSSFVQSPWGPEFQRMQQETWNTAMHVRNGPQPNPNGFDPRQAYNPFVSGVGPSGASANDRQQPIAGNGSPTESNGRSTGAMTPATTAGYVTLSSGPRTMAELLVGDR